MVSTRKKRHSNKRPLNQLNDFDEDEFIGNTVSDRQENATVNEGTSDHEFNVDASGSNLVANDNLVIWKIL